MTYSTETELRIHAVGGYPRNDFVCASVQQPPCRVGDQRITDLALRGLSKPSRTVCMIVFAPHKF